MFENAIAMAVLPASDQERARRFWSDVFGLTPLRSDMGGDFYIVGGVPLLVYETQFAGTAQNTSFGLFTDDLDRDMAALREKGVTFNEYDLPGLKTENGVVDMDGERGAWFNDSEGNIISIAQPTSISLDDAKAMLSAQRA
ncbi:catechol 2,3-dioxygenase-like lactoylglutathione lyase family enzyme [Agromyces ramosus]|uniref:Catechol 2,3-dioxygenase-like lactoylglutathione lyase family enzyme n=2 Tax=Agromyces ramosus TaxID=33879 RepID=A0ABU0RBL4_9MICO|nr:catechol 2,3-dioxygenase-like lactoylglutathione lyase family enzyme [Agromyces ramosus]